MKFLIGLNVFISIGNLTLLLGVINKLNNLKRQGRKLENTMALDFTALNAAVANNTTVEQSAITLITQIAQEIAQNADDQATVSTLADQLNQQASALAASVAANTPGAPPVPPVTTTAAPTN
jgi:hypothetical protein